MLLLLPHHLKYHHHWLTVGKPILCLFDDLNFLQQVLNIYELEGDALLELLVITHPCHSHGGPVAPMRSIISLNAGEGKIKELGLTHQPIVKGVVLPAHRLDDLGGVGLDTSMPFHP